MTTPRRQLKATARKAAKAAAKAAEAATVAVAVTAIDPLARVLEVLTRDGYRAAKAALYEADKAAWRNADQAAAYSEYVGRRAAVKRLVEARR